MKELTLPVGYELKCVQIGALVGTLNAAALVEDIIGGDNVHLGSLHMRLVLEPNRRLHELELGECHLVGLTLLADCTDAVPRLLDVFHAAEHVVDDGNVEADLAVVVSDPLLLDVLSEDFIEVVEELVIVRFVFHEDIDWVLLQIQLELGNNFIFQLFDVQAYLVGRAPHAIIYLVTQDRKIEFLELVLFYLPQQYSGKQAHVAEVLPRVVDAPAPAQRILPNMVGHQRVHQQL